MSYRNSTDTTLRATLDEGPGSNKIEQSYWLRAINRTHGLYMRVQDQKGQIEAKPKWHLFLEGKSIGSDQKFLLKGELMIWRTKMQARVQGMVQLKDSICFK
jgi:hypothetical protein